MTKPEPNAAARRIEYLPVNQVEGAPRNPKAHLDEDVQKSMGRFGYTEPLLMDERTKRLVAGHGRLEALLQLRAKGGPPPAGVQVDGSGNWLVPVVRGWASKDDKEAEAYLLASNQLTAGGGWNEGALAEILAELQADGPERLEGLGFGNDYLSKLLDELAPKQGKTDPDDVPAAPDGPLRVALGDVWLLGEHRIICGDSTLPEVLDRLMGSDLAAIAWTDPPWNIAYDGEESRGRPSKNRPIANDNLGDKFPEFCGALSRALSRALSPGAPLYLAMSTSEMPTVDVALKHAGFHWSSTIIWAKDQLNVSRKDYHPQYEPIWYGWKDGAARLVPLTDRTQSDLWPIARPKKSEEHPTMKPVELIARALKNSSRLGDIVFEPFSGSGSTLIACEQLGRRCRAIELEPRYVQVAIERWEAFTGRIAKKG